MEKRKLLIIVISAGFLLAGLALLYIISDFDLRAKLLAKLFDYPTVSYVSASPADEGLDPEALNRLANTMFDQRTNAFLVVRGGKLVYEQYSKTHGVNKVHYTAAMAKAISGITTLLVCTTEGYLSLDDPLWKYYPKIK